MSRVLVLCEYSGVVSQAFADLGHDVLSVDLLPSEKKLPHFQGSVWDTPNIFVPGSYDLAVCFPPCTFLCRAQCHLLVSPGRKQKSVEAVKFVRRLWNLPIPQIAIENPIGVLSSVWKSPSQITSFNYFGDPYHKDICLWLRNLPNLAPTRLVPGTKRVSNHVNSRMSQELKSKIKSRFFPGIAAAMASQWGSVPSFRDSLQQKLNLK